MIHGSVLLAEAQNTNFSFSSSSSPDSKRFLMVSDAQLTQSRQLFLPDEPCSIRRVEMSNNSSTFSCGRLLCKDRLRMKASLIWDHSSEKIANKRNCKHTVSIGKLTRRHNVDPCPASVLDSWYSQRWFNMRMEWIKVFLGTQYGSTQLDF